ncbi:toprim domain-containing protein [Nitratireductor sp. XY-223]|uniref:DUF7146 domain-containing protein n=1 Tax=Nitratireductor sp. XY-223 TaxID=2561926 RepID=UPI0010A9B098|nr:toprim domain-containing protein [Nitratireductor sp. XY-223]
MSAAREIVEQLAARTEAFCRAWFPNGRRVGNYWKMGDTTGAAGRSLAIRLRPAGGRAAGRWSDYATDEFGDLIDLIEMHKNCSKREAFNEARRFLGRPDPEPDRPSMLDGVVSGRSSDKTEAGRRLFSIGRPVGKTPAERYLRGRNISRFGSALAYHSRVYFRDADDQTRQLPALLAAITDNDGAITGCARTFLDVRNDALAPIEEPKRVLGRLYGNAIRFAGRPGSEDLVAGEGLETVLSVGSAFPLLSLAACLTANHLGLFDPPPQIRRLWIARDNGTAGENAAARLRARVEPMGMTVYELAPERDDFNSDLQEDGLMALRVRLTAAMRDCGIDPPEVLQR